MNSNIQYVFSEGYETKGEIKMNVKKRISHAILALILILGPVFNAIPVWAGSTSSVWSPVSSLPTGNTLSGVTYGNGIYVAVGSSGTILTSVNGTDSWVSHDSGATDLNGVACGVDGNGGVLFAAVGSNGTILTSADGTAWVSRTSGTAADLKGITYGGGQFVAVGTGGTILTSADGTTWTSITNSGTPYTANTLYGITCGSDGYGRNIFVAVGSGGTILTSPDGETWSDYSNSSVSTDDIFGAAYGFDSNGDSLFSAVGSNGTILTSSDGETWTRGTNPVPAANLKEVTYGDGQFMAVGDSGTILVSTYGATWTSQSYSTSNSLYGVACGSNYFVTVGQSAMMLYSGVNCAAGAATVTSAMDIDSHGNGSDLEVRFNKAADESRVSQYRIMVVPAYPSNVAINFNVIKANAVSAGNYTVANKTGSNITVTLSDTANDVEGYPIENDSTYKVFILSVADGVNATVNTLSAASPEVSIRMWNWANPNPTGNTFNGTAYGNNLYVVVGDSSAIFTSPDGTNWTGRTSDTTYDLNGVAYGKGIFVAVGDGGTAVTSPDGTNWTHNDNAPYTDICGVAYGKGLFVAVCSDGTILTSPDGVTWINRRSSANLRAITYGNGYFVGVGNSGSIMTSSDGRTWTSIMNSGTPYTTESFYGITYGGSRFVAVGTNGTIMVSSDGTSWSSSTASFEYGGSTYPYDNTTMAVTYGNGRYLAMSSRIILTSSDGTTWSTNSSGPAANIYGLVYGNGLFVAAGDKGIITLPPDAAGWTRRSSGITNYLKGVIHDGSRFVAVGGKSVLTSADGATWNSQSITGEYYLDGIACGENAAHQKFYVAVGDTGYPSGSHGIIMNSTDGITWSINKTRTDGNTPPQ